MNHSQINPLTYIDIWKTKNKALRCVVVRRFLEELPQPGLDAPLQPVPAEAEPSCCRRRGLAAERTRAYTTGRPRRAARARAGDRPCQADPPPPALGSRRRRLVGPRRPVLRARWQLAGPHPGAPAPAGASPRPGAAARRGPPTPGEEGEEASGGRGGRGGKLEDRDV